MRDEAQNIAKHLKDRGIIAAWNFLTPELAVAAQLMIGDTIRMPRQQGFTILLVRQNFRFAAMGADRHYVMAASST